jgi:methanethiol S-methyltransferase
MIPRLATLSYGAIAYLAFVASSLYAALFLAGLAVPKGVDDGPDGPTWLAVVVDLALLSLFAVQHSLMARPWFKRAWTTVVPPAIERSTYVLASSAVIALLLWQWRPLPHQVWSVDPTWARTLLWAGYVAGWAVVLASTFLLGHSDMFGLKQVVARWRSTTYAEGGFRTPGLYRLVRHPLMVGFLIAFWSTPDMSVGRLLFAGMSSAYIVVAVRFEERDLRDQLGEPYAAYAAEVPRFVPRPRGGLALAARPRSHSAWEER